MLHEYFPQDSETSPSIRPSMEEQKQRLSSMLSANMGRMLTTPGFFEKLKQHHAERLKKYFPQGEPPKYDSDQFVAVSRHPYGKNLEDGSWQEGETIQIGFTKPLGNNEATTSYVRIADRVKTPDGAQLIVDEPFTQEEGEMVADMVDELLLAKTSGQIPDLVSHDLIGLLYVK